MARRCACERLLAFWEGDPRFALAGVAASAIWLRLVRAVQQLGDGSVFRMGSASVSVGDIATVIRTQETETEPALNRLLELGLLAREADGAWSIPWLAEGAARTNAARSNGLRGGRPRKGETPEEAMRRRQGHLPLPIEGGRETDAKPKAESSRASTESSSSSSPPPSPQSLDARALVALVEELAEIAGMDPARGGYNGSAVRAWLARGATPELLREVVRRVRSRSSAAIAGFAYFNRAVEEAIAAAAEAPVSVAASIEESAWARALEDHMALGGNPAEFPSPAEWRARQAA